MVKESKTLICTCLPDKLQNTSIKRNSCHDMVTRSEGLQQSVGGSHARAEHQAVAGGLQTGQGLLQVTPAGVAIPTIHWLTLYLLSYIVLRILMNSRIFYWI